MNPGDFDIVREIAVDANADGDVDTAEYQSAHADATIIATWAVATTAWRQATRAWTSSTTSKRSQFSDGCFVLATDAPCGTAGALNATASGGEVQASLELAGAAGVNTQSAPTEVQFTLQELNADGSWVPVTGAEVESDALEQTLTVPEGTEGELRVVATYVDSDGVLHGSTSEVLPGG